MHSSWGPEPVDRWVYIAAMTTTSKRIHARPCAHLHHDVRYDISFASPVTESPHHVLVVQLPQQAVGDSSTDGETLNTSVKHVCQNLLNRFAQIKRCQLAWPTLYRPTRSAAFSLACTCCNFMGVQVSQMQSLSDDPWITLKGGVGWLSAEHVTQRWAVSG